MLAGGVLARLFRAGGVVVWVSLMGLLAGVLTGEFGSEKSNRSTAARPFLRGCRVFDWGVLVVRGFLGLIADWGFDKKSCALNSAGVGAGELALLLLLRLGCGAKFAVSDRGISGPFGG
jgi:hypothetical protein